MKIDISKLRPGMYVTDSFDYEFVVADVSEVYEDEWGECIQVSTQCGNTVFYNPGQMFILHTERNYAASGQTVFFDNLDDKTN